MDGTWDNFNPRTRGSLSKALKLELKNSSKKNEIIAPRIYSFSTFNSKVKSPDEAREWVRNNAKEGSDGIKFFGASTRYNGGCH